ncbi:MAG: hypothetical protein NT034_03300 [Candidatus Magasanikbacteria bacterium]|nr:hypothetical protein [Candidatus Magasanikbacteria bacterium]
MQKIYKYFYQDLSIIEQSLENLVSFDISRFASLEEVESFKNIINFLNDIVKDKELNEYLWLDKQFFNLLDSILINQVVSSANKQEIDSLIINLKLVSAALGEGNGLARYDVKNIIDCINLSKKDFDYTSLIYSLRQELAGNYSRDLVKAIFVYLQKVEAYKDWEIKDLIVFILLLNIVWKNFDFILPVEQEYILSLFYYVSIFIGIPVGSYLKASIHNTTNNPVDFVLKNKIFFEALQKNIEVVPAQEDISRVADLRDVFVAFISNKSTPNDFANNFYQSNEKVLKSVLIEVLSVFYGLKQANLAEKNYAGEDNIADDFDYQQSELLSWFFAKEEWSKIESYYQQPNPLVPVGVFLNKFNLFIDLNKEEAINKLVEFSEFLKSKKLLSADKEIIIFHESDGQFHWNDQIFS